jgi:large subunit ribosomal protein L22
MSAEEEQGEVTPERKEGAGRPAAKKARARKPAKAAKGAGAKAAGKEAAPNSGEAAKPAAKRASKKPAARKATAKEPVAKEPVAAEPKKARRGKALPTKPRRKVVRAHARYVRTSARKARMVCGHLRGKSVQEARAILAFTPREVARDWSKLLESAVANAESNHELLEDDLIVREAFADEGPTIKRFRPRAMGRATPIRKRTSHLTIALTPDPAPRTTKRDG